MFATIHIRSAALMAVWLSCLCTLLGMVGCAAMRTGPALQSPATTATAPEPSPQHMSAAAAGAGEWPAREVVLFYTGNNTSDGEVAAEIVASLEHGRFSVTAIDIEADAHHGEMPMAGSAAVAVGREAAARALERLPGRPLVVCRVFNYYELVASEAPLWGVSALPPLSLQLRGWKAVDPSLSRIGLIVSEAHAGLVADFTAAANAIGADVTVARSASDRETLYLFKRMAPGIDGFWLLPDSGILSPGVLRELLGYALSHQVGVLVSSEALLPWGALLSARSLPADVAASVRSVLERVVAGRTDQLARLSPLSQVALEFNPEAARRLGLAIVPDTRWVLREPD